jgi:hypothetical protein
MPSDTPIYNIDHSSVQSQEELDSLQKLVENLNDIFINVYDVEQEFEDAKKESNGIGDVNDDSIVQPRCDDDDDICDEDDVDDDEFEDDIDVLICIYSVNLVHDEDEHRHYTNHGDT